MSASMETIVVGVDGSEGGAAALEFAAREAAFRGAHLRIIAAWQVPVPTHGVEFGPPLDTLAQDAFRVGAQHMADDALAAARKLHPSLDGEALPIQGQPADVLLEQSADAALVVFVRRGLGGFRSLLLGSVSQQVVQHATCPGRRRESAGDGFLTAAPSSSHSTTFAELGRASAERVRSRRRRS
jgi:nucleotide-binding universal stress UspA family protein